MKLEFLVNLSYLAYAQENRKSPIKIEYDVTSEFTNYNFSGVLNLGITIPLKKEVACLKLGPQIEYGLAQIQTKTTLSALGFNIGTIIKLGSGWKDTKK